MEEQAFMLFMKQNLLMSGYQLENDDLLKLIYEITQDFLALTSDTEE